jgi:osmotically-inducible protein OsmY
MKSNEDLQKDVQEAIKWEPLLKAAEIGVTVKEGIVTLTGTVDSYLKKSEAEDAAKNVTGVKAVVEKITVNFGTGLGKIEDNEIAREILNAFKWNWEIPNDKIKVKVEKGWVTLEGELEWNYQREAGIKAVKNLDGVTGVSNNMKIKSEINDRIEKKDIESALRRNWSIDDKNINVNVHGSNVILDGTVDSWYEKDAASRIAWNAPGVSTVANNLVIEYD